jgi:hypothetical protein
MVPGLRRDALAREARLFEGGLPKGVQMMIVNLIKSAAPEVVEKVDQLAEIVRQFKVQLDRVEAKLDAITEANYVGSERKSGTLGATADAGTTATE